MGKLFVRLTLVVVSLYMLACFYIAQFYGEDIMDDWYSVLFGIIIAIYAFSEGRYHCRYLKYTAISLPCADAFTRIDNAYDVLSVTAHNLIPIGILALGLGTTITLAIRHFIHVNRLRNARKRTISNQENGTSPMG